MPPKGMCFQKTKETDDTRLYRRTENEIAPTFPEFHFSGSDMKISNVTKLDKPDLFNKVNRNIGKLANSTATLVI